MKVKIAILGFLIARSIFWIGGFDIFVRTSGNASSLVVSIVTGGFCWLIAALADGTVIP